MIRRSLVEVSVERKVLQASQPGGPSTWSPVRVLLRRAIQAGLSLDELLHQVRFAR